MKKADKPTITTAWASNALKERGYDISKEQLDDFNENQVFKVHRSFDTSSIIELFNLLEKEDLNYTKVAFEGTVHYICDRGQFWSILNNKILIKK